MIDTNDLKYIHQDLSELIEALLEKEEYEKCKQASDYKSAIEKYLAGDVEDKYIINPLFNICFSRYVIFRLVCVRGKRYVVFRLPNGSNLSFDVQPDHEAPSRTWISLEQEYERITHEITKSIIRTMHHE